MIWFYKLPHRALFLFFLTIGTASAHTGSGSASGFISGFTHPILGWDHLIAMLAVGLWGAFLGNPSIWLLPIVFPLVMTFGATAGIVGTPIPGIEIGIAISAVTLGALVAFAARPPIWISSTLVGIFALFHGYAHGTELPQSANPLVYSVGFVTATGVLHLLGIGFGLIARWPAGKIAVQTGGSFIALMGIAFLSKIAS
ncbi:MAG: HupE/UreJ family protein [Gammaproteobacteria bacterium]